VSTTSSYAGTRVISPANLSIAPMFATAWRLMMGR
jgi:hypothetical protein